MSATQKAAKGQDVVEPKAKHSGPDFESELEFYGSYHFNFYNKAIHFVCIPLIMWSSHILLSHLTLPGTEPHLLAKGFAYQPSIAMLVAIGYQLYYFYLEPVAGATFLPWTLISYLTATYLAKFPSAGIPYSSAANPSSTPFAWLVFTSSWIAQFIGHGFFEKRAPALKDNLVQALVTAPFFVHLELLFDVLGYKPEVNKRVKRRIANRVHAMRKQDKEKARA